MRLKAWLLRRRKKTIVKNKEARYERKLHS